MHLTGQIPTEVGSLTALTNTVTLRSNTFTGSSTISTLPTRHNQRFLFQFDVT